MGNVSKSKAMMYQPGAIRYGMSEEAVVWQSTGRAEMNKERLRW